MSIESHAFPLAKPPPGLTGRGRVTTKGGYVVELVEGGDVVSCSGFKSRAVAELFFALLDRYGVDPRSGAANEAWVEGSYGRLGAAEEILREYVDRGEWLEPL